MIVFTQEVIIYMCVSKEVCNIRTQQLERNTEDIKDLTACVIKLTEIVNNQTTSTNEISNRLKNIEKSKRAVTEKIFVGVAVAVISSLITILITGG